MTSYYSCKNRMNHVGNRRNHVGNHMETCMESSESYHVGNHMDHT